MDMCFFDFAIFIDVHIVDNIGKIHKGIFYPGKNLLAIIAF